MKKELFYDVVNRVGWKLEASLQKYFEYKKNCTKDLSGEELEEEKKKNQENNDNCHDSIMKHCVLDYPSPACEAKNMFGRSKIVELSRDPRAYDEPLFPVKFDDEQQHCWSAFRDENLNSAIECVRLYLKKSHRFYHCMVRAAVFDSFTRAVKEDGSKAKILPFSCWCDGARGRSQLRELEKENYLPLYRHHRHFIIIYPLSSSGDNLFSNVISKVEIPDGKYFDNYVYERPIYSAMELVKTIGYLSNRKSLCSGSGREEHTFPEPFFDPYDDYNWYCTLDYPFSSSSRSDKWNHFWIFAPLPENFELPLVLQWEGGLTRWIYEIYGNSLPPEFFEGTESFCENEESWQVELRDLPDIRKVLVLPELKREKNVWYDTVRQVLLEKEEESEDAIPVY